MDNKEEKYAANLIEKSMNNIEKAEKELKKLYPVLSNVITLCQQSIELSTKALFKLMSTDFPRDHEIRFESKETEKLLSKNFAKNFYEKDKIPRLIFLTQFWKKFYLLAKYGNEKFNIGPDDLFEKEEAKVALKHAKECLNITRSLESSIQIQKLNDLE